MTRDGKPQRQIREQIAHLAARLMAEDGIEDIGTAKRKAARQCGVADQRNLPTNEEVEPALCTYRALYQANEQRERLKTLRELALDMMQSLATFNPHLSGSVLSGNAGRYAQIEIDLFTDSPKAVEYFLVDSGLDFKVGSAASSWEKWHAAFPISKLKLKMLSTASRCSNLKTCARRSDPPGREGP